MLLLAKSFYEQPAEVVAKQILGKFLIRRLNNKLMAGSIVETEAYIPFTDPAAHSFIGKTLHNSVLFGPPGYCYVYSIHRYFCLNVVCDAVNIPGCVLIRAIEPMDGVELMQQNRGRLNTNITNGPGRLCQALQINRNLNGTNLTNAESELFITDGYNINAIDTVTTTRIGITKAKELPLRFYIKGNKYVSRKGAEI